MCWVKMSQTSHAQATGVASYNNHTSTPSHPFQLPSTSHPQPFHHPMPMDNVQSMTACTHMQEACAHRDAQQHAAQECRSRRHGAREALAYRKARQTSGASPQTSQMPCAVLQGRVGCWGTPQAWPQSPGRTCIMTKHKLLMRKWKEAGSEVKLDHASRMVPQAARVCLSQSCSIPYHMEQQLNLALRLTWGCSSGGTGRSLSCSSGQGGTAGSVRSRPAHECITSEVRCCRQCTIKMSCTDHAKTTKHQNTVPKHGCPQNMAHLQALHLVGGPDGAITAPANVEAGHTDGVTCNVEAASTCMQTASPPLTNKQHMHACKLTLGTPHNLHRSSLYRTAR